jgi:RimJ/RimL family protein N-acetyltransferase
MFPDAVLTSARLTLRPPLTQTWLPLPNPFTAENARSFCQTYAPEQRMTGRGLVRAIEEDGHLVGCIDLKRTDWKSRVTEIGYWSAPVSRGRGVITEATGMLARWALTDQDFARVELRIAPANVASQRVAEKAGFVREGVARSAGYVHAGRVDLTVWSLIRADLG